MTSRKYDTPQHRRLRDEYRRLRDEGQAWCMETICLEERDGRTRWIPPGAPLHVAHTDDGRAYKGPAHARCNNADGARRGNAMRVQRPARRRVL